MPPACSFDIASTLSGRTRAAQFLTGISPVNRGRCAGFDLVNGLGTELRSSRGTYTSFGFRPASKVYLAGSVDGATALESAPQIVQDNVRDLQQMYPFARHDASTDTYTMQTGPEVRPIQVLSTAGSDNFTFSALAELGAVMDYVIMLRKYDPQLHADESPPA